MLDLARLEKIRVRGAKLICRCPACAEMGADKSGEHLVILDEGRGPYRCIVDSVGKGGSHARRIFELVGKPEPCARWRPTPPTVEIPTVKAKPRIPKLRALNVSEMAAIQNQRGWPSFVGLQLLTQRSLLWHGMVWDNGEKWPAWIITDSSRRNAQARRIDGRPWSCGKAKSLIGSAASWPIGASDIGARPIILLCEGGPDFLTTLLVAWWEGGQSIADTIAPVCMAGAGNSIHTDTLPLFAGKHIRIAAHADDIGLEAGKRWARQLYGAGAARVDGFDFSGLVRRDGQPMKDLADFAAQLDVDVSPSTSVFEALSHLGYSKGGVQCLAPTRSDSIKFRGRF